MQSLVSLETLSSREKKPQTFCKRVHEEPSTEQLLRISR